MTFNAAPTTVVIISQIDPWQYRLPTKDDHTSTQTSRSSDLTNCGGNKNKSATSSLLGPDEDKQL